MIPRTALAILGILIAVAGFALAASSPEWKTYAAGVALMVAGAVINNVVSDGPDDAQ